MLLTLRQAIALEKVSEVLGRAGVRTIQDHLRARDASHPNALGGRRTHFWSAAARSTTYRTVSDGALISISHAGAALQYFGGTVRPVNRKFLSIPAIPEAHGMSPSDFSDLEPITFRLPGRPPLHARVQRDQQRISFRKDTRKGAAEGAKRLKRGAETRGIIYFWLVKSATIGPHPDVLPPTETIQADANTAVASYLSRWKARTT
jgi:hypothetical protein